MGPGFESLRAYHRKGCFEKSEHPFFFICAQAPYSWDSPNEDPIVAIYAVFVILNAVKNLFMQAEYLMLTSTGGCVIINFSDADDADDADFLFLPPYQPSP